VFNGGVGQQPFDITPLVHMKAAKISESNP
jgi:hypothetical protein